ncbi:MAG: cupredoxin domain-containing protein [Chitinivorax sp.]
MMKAVSLALTLAATLAALPASATPKDQPRERTAIVGEDGTQRQDVYVGNYYYRPDRITVKVGKPVELMFRIPDGINKHKFVIKAADAGMSINTFISQRNNVVTFTPTKTGTYKFYCDHQASFLQPHVDQGESGELIVVE